MTTTLRHAGDRTDRRVGSKAARDSVASRIGALDHSKKKLLTALAAYHGPVPVDSLAVATGINPGWTRGHLIRLGELGFVRQTCDGWLLEDAARPLARQFLATDVSLALILPVEDALRQLCDSDHERRVLWVLKHLFPGGVIMAGQPLRDVFHASSLEGALAAGDRAFLVHPQAHLDWTVYGGRALLPMLAVEVDSPWHDTPISQERDERKNRICRVGGLPLARVRLNPASDDGVILHHLGRALGRLAREARLGERAHGELAEALSHLWPEVSDDREE